MSILTYGDIHFVNKTRFYSHIEAATSACNFIAKQINKQKPNFVINLGDTFHHEWLDTPTIWYAYKAMEQIAEACAQIDAYHIILVGNHETYLKHGDMDPLVMFEHLPFTTVVRQPMIIPYNEDISFALIPYIHETKRLRNILTKAAASAQLLFTHIPIIGAMFNPQALEEKGILPSELSAFNLTVNGHYHHPQTLEHNIHFTGSPLFQDFNDHPTKLPRGTLTINPIDLSTERATNPHTPIYMKVNVTTQEEFQTLLNLPKKEKFVVKATTTPEFTKAIEALKSQFRGLFILTQQPNIILQEEATLSIITDPREAVTQYAEATHNSPLSKPKLTETGLTILQEVT